MKVNVINSIIKMGVVAVIVCIFTMPGEIFGKTHEIHVSANAGDDANDGAPGRPLASLRRATETVRSIRTTHPADPVTVMIHPGRYHLEKSLRLTAADSGASESAPVTYMAAGGNGSEVEISGGHPIETPWHPHPDRPGIWRTRLTGWGDKQLDQLWVNGSRAVLAQTPDWREFFYLTSVEEIPVGGADRDVVHRFVPENAASAVLSKLTPADIGRARVLVYHKWDTTREFIQSVDPTSGTFETRGQPMKSWNPMNAGCHFTVENIEAALDSPGEWFFDQATGWLNYMPRPGEAMDGDSPVPVVAGGLDRLLHLDGGDGHVSHLHFKGLRFRHAGMPVPPGGNPPQQAAMGTEASAILIERARDIHLTGCRIENVGTSGIWMRADVRDCSVRNTRLFDLGVGGIRIGETSLVPETHRTGHITIDNCIIQSGGRVLPSAVGVWIGHSGDNSITHCDIADFFYTAVSVGWRWGYSESGAVRNTIAFNHLHHIGYRILSDMGGIYTLGPSEGTRIHHNVIHDIYSSRYGGWGLYPDEGSSGIILENNVVYNVTDGAFHQHYGRDNVVRNNILAFSEKGQIAVTRSEPHLSFSFTNNIVYWDRGQLLGYGGWKAGAQVHIDHNLYWQANGQPFDFIGQSFAQWQSAGNDRHSLIANPLFRDVKNHDFSIPPYSPAHRIGFQPWDYSAAGVYGSLEWKTLASITPFPDPIPKH